LQSSEFARHQLERQVESFDEHKPTPPVVEETTASCRPTASSSSQTDITVTRASECQTEEDDLPHLYELTNQVNEDDLETLKQELQNVRAELVVARAVAAVSISTPDSVASLPSDAPDREQISIFSKHDQLGKHLRT